MLWFLCLIHMPCSSDCSKNTCKSVSLQIVTPMPKDFQNTSGKQYVGKTSCSQFFLDEPIRGLYLEGPPPSVHVLIVFFCRAQNHQQPDYKMAFTTLSEENLPQIQRIKLQKIQAKIGKERLSEKQEQEIKTFRESGGSSRQVLESRKYKVQESSHILTCEESENFKSSEKAPHSREKHGIERHQIPEDPTVAATRKSHDAKHQFQIFTNFNKLRNSEQPRKNHHTQRIQGTHTEGIQEVALLIGFYA